MTTDIKSIEINKLLPHPDNPNRMSKTNFAKLVRNIKRTGRYEPLVVRPMSGKEGYFQIINGHHRWQALTQLGYIEADAVIWDIDDQQTDILLATLNRLGGSDILDKKLALLARLNQRLEARELTKLLPQTAKQIQRLSNMKTSRVLAAATANCFANTLIFFVNDQQQKIIENALSVAATYLAPGFTGGTQTKAEALTEIAKEYLAHLGVGAKP